MRKDKHTVVAIVFLLAIAIRADADPYMSIATDTSFGLIETPLDAALTVEERPGNPQFSTLDHSFVLGGVGNLGGLTATQQQAAGEEQPGFLGFYIDVPRPFSVSARVSSNTAGDETIQNSVTTEYDEVTDSLTTDSDGTYRWITSDTTTVYDFQQASGFSTGVLYNQSLGALNAGVRIGFGYSRGDMTDPLTWADQNKKVVEAINYNASADSPPPEARLDYKIISTYSAPATQTEIALGLPLFFRTGEIGHSLSLSGSYLERDDSSSELVTSTEPLGAGPASGTLIDTSESVTDLTSCLTVGGGYRLTVPSLFGGRPENALRVGVSGSYYATAIEPLTTSSSTSVFAIDMSATEGSRKVLTSSASTESSAARTIPDWFQAQIAADQLLHFDIGADHVLRIGPGIAATYSTEPIGLSPADALSANIVPGAYSQTVSTDSDGDGETDSIIVTTHKYQVNATPLSAQLEARLTVPVAVSLTVTPAFSLLLGSESEFFWRRIRVRDADVILTEEVEETKDPDGALVYRSETISDPTMHTAVTSNRSYSEAEVTTTQRMALRISLPAAVSLYIVADWSRFFDFDDLTVQAVVPLP